MNRWIMTDESIINTHYIHRIFAVRPAYASLYYLKADTGFSAEDWQFDVPFEKCQMVGEPFFEMNENEATGRFILRYVKIINKTTNKVLFTFDMTGDEKDVEDKAQLDR